VIPTGREPSLHGFWLPGCPAWSRLAAVRTCRWAVGITAVFSLTASGCRADPGCADNAVPCGGNAAGTWTVVGACRDPVYAPPMQATYLGQPAQVARQPIPNPTSSDWCSSLTYGNGSSITGFVFHHDTLNVSSGRLVYNDDGSYQHVINTIGPGSIDLSHECLTRSGTAPTCEALATALTAFAGQMQAMPGMPCSDSPAEPASCQYYYSYRNIACSDDSQRGCRCTYTASFAGTYQGRWSAQGSILNHFDASSLLPTQADFCVDGSGGLMTLWGHDRTPILGEPGLLTLSLQRAQ
jgi:hypothetical protein